MKNEYVRRCHFRGALERHELDAAPQEVRAGRRAERRGEGAAPPPAREAQDEAAVPGTEAPAEPVASNAESFRVHDLSRRWVEYQMGERFAAPVAARLAGRRRLYSA